jgi:hypothetical protein
MIIENQEFSVWDGVLENAKEKPRNKGKPQVFGFNALLNRIFGLFTY